MTVPTACISPGTMRTSQLGAGSMSTLNAAAPRLTPVRHPGTDNPLENREINLR